MSSVIYLLSILSVALIQSVLTHSTVNVASSNTTNQTVGDRIFWPGNPAQPVGDLTYQISPGISLGLSGPLSFIHWLFEQIFGDAKCLAGDGLVFEFKSKRYKRVDDLKSGDVVQTRNGKSDVIMISHSSRTSNTLFTRIETENGDVVSLTPSHLIPVISNGIPSFIYADNVSIKDYLYTHPTNNGTLGEAAIIKVKSVKHEMKIGFYSPITVDGTIVVNNIEVSVYATINSHYLVHHSFAPLRGLYALKKYLMSNSHQEDENFYVDAQCHKSSDTSF